MTKFIFCRHGERSDRGVGVESVEYWGLTRNGVIEVRKKTEALIKTIEDAPNNTAIILGGCSKAIRTKSTLQVFTDELRRIYEKEKGIIFSQPFNSETPLETLNAIKALEEISMRSNASKRKIIIDFPLHIEEFIAQPGQTEKKIAKELLVGLLMAVGFFQRFLTSNPLILVNIGHSIEMEALANFLAKENGSVHHNCRFSFTFM